MKFNVVNKLYCNRRGDLVRVVGYDSNDSDGFPVKARFESGYNDGYNVLLTKKGRYFSREEDHAFDLIEEVEEVARPKKNLLGETRIHPQGNPISGGLTLRQHYAGLAMQGMCANPDPQVCQAPPETIAKWAVALADALLEELTKE